MKTFFHRALFYKELKKIWWIAVLLSIYFLFNFYLFIRTWYRMIPDAFTYMYELKKFFYAYIYNPGGNTSIFIFILFILSLLLMRDDRDMTTHSFIHSMPFKRSQIIGTKWITGALIISIPFLLNVIFFSFAYSLYFQAMDNIKILDYTYFIRLIFMGVTFYLLLFSIYMFIQSVCGDSLAGGIIGTVIIITLFTLIFPFKELFMSAMFTDVYIDSLVSVQFMELFQSYIQKSISIYLNKYNYLSTSYQLEEMIELLTHNFVLNSILHTGITGLLTFLTIYTYKKNKLEKLGTLILFPYVKIIYHMSVSYLFGVVFFKPLFSFSFESPLLNTILGNIILLSGLLIGFLISVILSTLVDQKRISFKILSGDKSNFWGLVIIFIIFMVILISSLPKYGW